MLHCLNFLLFFMRPVMRNLVVSKLWQFVRPPSCRPRNFWSCLFSSQLVICEQSNNIIPCSRTCLVGVLFETSSFFRFHPLSPCRTNLESTMGQHQSTFGRINRFFPSTFLVQEQAFNAFDNSFFMGTQKVAWIMFIYAPYCRVVGNSYEILYLSCSV